MKKDLKHAEKTNNPDHTKAMNRRDFLVGLKKWSKAIVGGALVAGAMGYPVNEAKAGAAGWVNRRGGWGNHAGWVNRGGGGWGNHGGWINGGGGGWINHAPWMNGGGWINHAPWANGGAWFDHGGGGWLNGRGPWHGGGWVNLR